MARTPRHKATGHTLAATDAVKTIGVSPKAILAAVLPLLAGLVGVGVQWVATGTFDRAELATAISTGAASILAGLGAFAGKPGTVQMKALPTDPRPPIAGGAPASAGFSLAGLLVGVLVGAVVFVVLVWLVGAPYWLGVLLLLVCAVGGALSPRW